MASNFQQYTNGIQPVSGMSEAGANIGRNYQQGIQAFGLNLAEGIKEYHKNSALNDQSLADADAMSHHIASMQEMLLSDPEYAQFAHHLDPLVNDLSSVKTKALPARLGILNQAKATWGEFNRDLGVYEQIKSSQQRRAIGEFNPETGVQNTSAMGQAEGWSNGMSFNDNEQSVRNSYRNQVSKLPAGAKPVAEQEYVDNWKRNLPNAINSNDKMSPQAKAYSLDLVGNVNSVDEFNNSELSNHPMSLFDRYYSNARDNEWAQGQGSPQSAPAGLPLPSSAINSGTNATSYQGDPAAQTGLPDINLPSMQQTGTTANLGTSAVIAQAPAPKFSSEQSLQLYNEFKKTNSQAIALQDKLSKQWGLKDESDISLLKSLVTKRTQLGRVLAESGSYTDPSQQTRTNIAPPYLVGNLNASESTSENSDSLYTIKKGDTPAMIANATGRSTTWVAKAMIAQGYNPNTIKVGTKIDLSVDAVGVGVPKPKEGVQIFKPRKVNKEQVDINNKNYTPPEPYDVSQGIEQYQNNSNEGALGENGPSESDINKFSTDTEGNISYTGDVNASKISPEKVVDSEYDATQVPLNILPVNTPSRLAMGNQAGAIASGAKLPEVSAQKPISSYTQPEQEKIRIAKDSTYERLSDIDSQKRSIQPAIGYLQAMRDSVAKGDSSMVDYNTIGQSAMMHPDIALATKVGADAALLWFGAGAKLGGGLKQGVQAIKGMKGMAQETRIAELAANAKKEYDGYLKVAEIGNETISSAGKKELLGNAIDSALREGGLIKASLTAAQKADLVAKVGTQAARGAFWTALVNGMVKGGKEDVPDNIYDATIRTEINSALTDVRKLRTGYGFAGGIPFAKELGAKDDMTSLEKSRIMATLDNKINDMKSRQQGFSGIEQQLKSRLVNHDMLLNDIYPKVLSGQDSTINPAYQKPSENNTVDSGTGVSDYTYVRPQVLGNLQTPETLSAEEKKTQLKQYLIKKFGYLPASFNDMYKQMYPEESLQFRNTPYGAVFFDGKEWKQMSHSGMQPHELAANKAVQFGQLTPNGDYVPTQFISTSPVKLGGLGSFGSPADASKFREEYTHILNATSIIDKLEKINETQFASLSPEQRGTALQLTRELAGNLRKELIGVGNVSDYEQKLLEDIVQNPTDFFSLKSTTRAKYNQLRDNVTQKIITKPQAFGLTVILPKDKSSDIMAARERYLQNLKK